MWRTGVAALAPEAQVAWVERRAEEYELAVAEAIGWILSANFTEEGAKKWLAAHAKDSPVEMIRAAIAEDGMIAT